MNKLSDEELENVNGGSNEGSDAIRSADLIISIDQQIQASPTKQPSQIQKCDLLSLKLKIKNAGNYQSNVSYEAFLRIEKAWEILSKYGI